MTEEDYIRKHYYDKAETSNSGIPMDMYVPWTMHRAPPQYIALTGHNRGSITEEMERNAMSGFHGQDAATGEWTMQPHLATQSSSYTKHGSNVYIKCLSNALQHGDRTETGPEGGFSLVR